YPRPSVQRENRGAVHETPREQLDELLVHGSPADLQFLREIFRVVEPFLEEPKDLAACFRPRNTDELQRFRHPGRRVVSAYFNVLPLDRKSTRLNSSHVAISYAVFCLKK